MCPTHDGIGRIDSGFEGNAVPIVPTVPVGTYPDPVPVGKYPLKVPVYGNEAVGYGWWCLGYWYGNSTGTAMCSGCLHGHAKIGVAASAMSEMTVTDFILNEREEV